MKSSNTKTALVSGASIAGLTTAWWLNQLGYAVTIVELANEPRLGGNAVNINGNAADVARRMGIFDQLEASRLRLESWEFKNADDLTEGTIGIDEAVSNDEIEIEREKLITILTDAVKNDVTFSFNNSIVALTETKEAVSATFKDGSQGVFDLVFGCDGLHSIVRKLWFGPEADYSHFLQHYFSLTIVNKSLVRQNTAQMYNVPGKVIMLNAYSGKTDIIFCFFSEKEIPYDYRNTEQQSNIIKEQFSGEGWRTTELLAEVNDAKTAYFDKICQIKMPSWTRSRVALVGDAGYCASPAAGMGGSLAMIGAAAVADALDKHNDDFEAAFQAYNHTLRPFIDEVQAMAPTVLNTFLIPATEEAIQERNAQTTPF